MIRGEWPARLLVAATLGAAWFAGAAGFGLYEDDYSLFAGAFEQSWGEVARSFRRAFVIFYRGRPLSWITQVLAGKLTAEAGTLAFAYGLAYGILLLNALLFHSLLRKLRPEPGFALLGALLFVLVPADTTRPFLNHAFALHPAVTFCLLAFHLYLSGQRPLAYGAAGLTLLTYETPFALFTLAPLLSLRREDRGGWAWAQHLGLLGLLLSLSLFLRDLNPEPRWANVGWATVVKGLGLNLLQGPARGLYAAGLRLFTGGDGLRLALSLAAAAVFFLALRRQRAAEGGLARLAAVGLALWIAAYVLDVVNPPWRIHGRASRVHLAAGFGLSLAGAALFLAARRRMAVTLVVALGLAGWLRFGWQVQDDYRAAWVLQRQHWGRILDLSRDWTPETVILLTRHGRPYTREIDPFGWASTRVFSQLFAFGEEAPRLYALSWWWQRHLKRRHGTIRLTREAAPGFLGEPESIHLSRVILLDWKEGELIRLDSPAELKGHLYTLKPRGEASPWPAPLRLHGFLRPLTGRSEGEGTRSPPTRRLSRGPGASAG